MPYVPKHGEVSSIEIIGYRQPDDRIRLGNGSNGTLLDDFPGEISLLGNVYGLEEKKKNSSSSNIEWGIYA